MARQRATITDPLNALAADAPKIDDLIILAGPSGCGKTTIAQAIIQQKPTAILSLTDGPATRTDARSLKAKQFVGGSLLVEYSTNPMTSKTARDAVLEEIDVLIKRANRTRVITCHVSRSVALRRYAGRLRPEKLTHTPEFLRYFRFGKIKQLARYAFGNQLTAGYMGWAQVQEILQQRHAGSETVTFQDHNCD